MKKNPPHVFFSSLFVYAGRPRRGRQRRRPSFLRLWPLLWTGKKGAEGPPFLNAELERRIIDSVVVTNHIGKIVYYNPAAEHMFGYIRVRGPCAVLGGR